MSTVSSGQLRQSYIHISRYVRQHIIPTHLQRNVVPFQPSHTSRIRCSVSADRRSTTRGARHVRCQQFCTFRSCQNSQIGGGSQSHLRDEHIKVIEDFSKSSDAIDTKAVSWASLAELQSRIESLNEQEKAQIYHIHGYITSRRQSKFGYFCQLIDPSLNSSIQLVFKTTSLQKGTHDSEDNGTVPVEILESLQPHTPVVVTGHVVSRPKSSSKPKKPIGSAQSGIETVFDPYIGTIDLLRHIEVRALTIQPLNSLPDSLVLEHGSNPPPEQRHLTLRTDRSLRSALHLRAKLRMAAANHLQDQGFQETETPLLFKSTPEGAREYIVPTRDPGHAYALPQSPQQYKQALMASGIHKYFQFARCFRDEDMRADRQPEFTQLDLEIAFASSRTVMECIERIVLDVLWPIGGRQDKIPHLDQKQESSQSLRLPIMTYHDAMQKYGSDKPDPSWGAEIHDVSSIIPAQAQSMLSSLTDPIIEMIKVSLDQDPRSSQQTVADFMRLSSSAQFSSNPDGMPGISVFNPSVPLSGLQSYGFEGASQIEELMQPEAGDILILQTRPRRPFSGGSTVLGQMRQRIHEYAVEQDLIPPPPTDSLLWIVDFPLFSPIDPTSTEPGQSGTAGLCSTHHPFTAPKPGQDLQALFSNPLSIIGDHYDLVINGTEIGGGSRRIHHASMQELIFRNILKMSPARIEDFRHLLNALGDGCPPHAGFAFGWDRLIALLTGAKSVRDVIAFPKFGGGREPFVGSPSLLTEEQLRTYHLSVRRDEGPSGKETKISNRA